MGADAESSCTESRTDSWSPDGARNPWSAPTTELWAPTGSTLPVSASHNSSLTGTSLLQPNAELWEPYDGRLSRTVLTEREEEVPSRLWVPKTRPWSLTCRDAGRC